MKTIVNSVQMKAVDEYTINNIGLPAIVLMERAALSVARAVQKRATVNDRILSVCGSGNNGADGIAAARILYTEGFSAEILLIGDERHYSELLKQQLNIARNLGMHIDNNLELNEYTIIIDAIFGIGLSRDVTGSHKEMIEKLNEGNQIIYAVDIPSGLSADTAKPMGIAVKADYTITFGLNKIGMLLYPGCEYSGHTTVSDIGFPTKAIESAQSKVFTYEPFDLDRLPIRKAYSNKGTYGKVLIIAGNINICGACLFSAKAAYRTGTGLVKVMTVSENRAIVQTQIPEALLFTYNADSFDEQGIENIISQIQWANSIVIGPGLGVGGLSEKLLDLVLENAKVPVVIDADGINLLAKKADKYFMSNNINSNRMDYIASLVQEKTILTPHLKELSVLLDRPLESITDNLIAAADICTNNNNLVFVIKDARTIVADKDMRYINTSGNNGMATGGSGDVLTGIIAALIAQGIATDEAARLGVYIHGLAGDKAKDEKGCYALIASDIIEALVGVLK